MSSLLADVDAYESWLRTQCRVVEEGLQEKHARMAKSALLFFRATCFRFARQIDRIAPDLRKAPKVLGVGDAHIENWGTWRDAEGRLVWGVNDFDEAARLPYTYDLLRLATSARLATDLPLPGPARIVAILAGYRLGLDDPGPLFVDDEKPWMQKLVNRPSAKVGAFRDELDRLDDVDPPRRVKKALVASLPDGTGGLVFRARQKGAGSLGRPRYVAIGCWRGGLVVREAKALVPSAWEWAAGKQGASHLRKVATGEYRSPDPFLKVRGRYIIRRIAPDSAKIDLTDDDAEDFGPTLLAAMGRELASIHLATPADPGKIARDLDRRGDGWLDAAAKTARQAARQDFQVWRDFREQS